MAFQLPSLPSFQVQPPDTFGAYSRMLQLKDLMAKQQYEAQARPLAIQQQQQAIQASDIENQLKQLQLQGQKALTAYWQNPDKFSSDASDFQHNDALAGMLGIAPDDPLMATVRAQIKAGVPAPMAFAEAKNTLQVRQEWSKATQEQQNTLKTAFEQLREISAPILAEKDANKKQELINNALPGLAAWAKTDPKLASVIPMLNAGNFDAFANRIGAEEKALDLVKKNADAAAAQQKVIPEGQSMSPEMQGQVAKDVAVAKAEQPLKIQLAGAEAAARQAAAQGSPEDAGKLLAGGQLTLADLKSRGTTPKFITQAVAAAQKLDSKYNPADEVIAEQVAKSPSANQFFGSANSLIGKGGTLDQLEALGKNIPQHDFPVLNTIDDWQKAARGKGPLAAYAAMALGVADDYGKVMGGGTASDHARDAALNLFSQAASPEQRAQAVQATRGAVLSQRDSRIGNNQFLRRQYGAEVGGQKVATQQHISDYAKAKGITAEQAAKEFKDAGYTVQ